MALAFWMYSIGAMLMRLRAIILERERTSDWATQLKERP
jgi:heme exporter protein C